MIRIGIVGARGAFVLRALKELKDVARVNALCDLNGDLLKSKKDELVNNGFPDIILGRLVTDYPNLYERLVCDYISVLKSAPPRYPFRLEFTEKKKVQGTNERK